MRPLGLVALALLSALCLGWPSSAWAQGRQDRSAELQVLADALVQQVTAQRRIDEQKANAAYAQLGQAIDAWQRAGRNQNDFEQMHAWLEQAIRATMPGSRQSLPPLPQFSQPQVARTAPPAESRSVASQPARNDGRTAEELPFASDAAAPHADTAPQPTPVATRTDRDTQAPVAEATNPWRRHPAATPLKLDDPFVDDPLTDNILPVPDDNRRVVLRPAASTTPRDTVEVNLAALAARIRGYDRGLRAVEAKLIAKPEMAEAELLLLTKELETLVEQRKLIDLYIGSLTESEKLRVATPEAVDGVKTLILDRVNKLRGSRSTDQFDEVFSEQPSPALEEVESMLERI